MPTFSADAELAALEPWRVVLGGRTFTAAPVSRPALVVFLASVERAKDKKITLAEEEAAIAQLLRVAFPWRFSYRWRDPVALIMAMDYRARQRVLESFCASLGVQMPPNPGTNGSSAE